MGLDITGPYISPPLIRARLSGTNQGARKATITRETQWVYFGQFQRYINAFLKRRVASDLLVQPSLLLVGSQTESCVLVALGISKAIPFYFIITN